THPVAGHRLCGHGRRNSCPRPHPSQARARAPYLRPHVTRVVRGLQVPATAQAMLAARIDRLKPEDKRLLQAAAVIGTDVPLELLQAVADEPEDRLRRGLIELQATEFLYETRLFQASLSIASSPGR